MLLRGSPLAADRFGPDIDEAESRWDALCSVRPEYFDGGLLAVGGVTRNGHGGVTLTVAPCPYRWYAVQDDAFDLGLRPLGVKALVRDSEGFLLCGQRSSTVHAYPNRWEFLPGGSVEPEEDPLQTVVRELEEEAGLVPQARRWPKRCAMTLWPEHGKWCTNSKSNAPRVVLLILVSTPKEVGSPHHLCRAPWPRSLNVSRIC